MRLQLVRAKPTSGTQVRWMAPKEGSYVSMLGNMFEEDGRLLTGGTNRDVSCHGERLSEREVGQGRYGTTVGETGLGKPGNGRALPKRAS